MRSGAFWTILDQCGSIADKQGIDLSADARQIITHPHGDWELMQQQVQRDGGVLKCATGRQAYIWLDF